MLLLNLNSQISVFLFYFLFLSSASSNSLWSRSKFGGSLTRGWLDAGLLCEFCSCIFLASFWRKSFSIRGGSLALAKFSWATLAILSFLIISSSCFFLRRSTEQNQGIGLALKTNCSRYSRVFLLVLLLSKLNGFSFARVMIMLHFLRSSFLRRCYSIMR